VATSVGRDARPARPRTGRRPVPTLLAVLALLTLPLGRVSRAEEKPNYRAAADNKIFAQTLVNDLMAQYPDLVTAGIHAVPPGGSAQMIVASTLNVIGKKSDPEDVDVGAKGCTQLVPNVKLGKFGVMLPLRDRSGKDIGALALAFKYHDGDDQVALFAEATAIRNKLAPQIARLADLFEPGH
jgi:hypothetical protein